MNKSELLDRVALDADERLLLSRVYDKAEQARRGTPACTGFLSPAQQDAALRLLNAAGHPRHLFAGGWPDAERKVCALLPDWQEEDLWEPPYAVLRCRWLSGEALTHRDFLGAILGAGLDREKVGDILVGDGSCDLFVFRELVPYLLSNFTGAGRAKLRVEEIPPEMVAAPRRTVKTIHDTVSSLRLDAVLSTGFSMARGKAAQLISAGRVERNHRVCLKPDQTVQEGDALTCRGLGKCAVTQVGGLSKKGRILITMERFL